jgi:hypothetical protein
MKDARTHNTEQNEIDGNVRVHWLLSVLFYSTVPDLVITTLPFGVPDCEPKFQKKTQMY